MFEEGFQLTLNRGDLVERFENGTLQPDGNQAEFAGSLRAEDWISRRPQIVDETRKRAKLLSAISSLGLVESVDPADPVYIYDKKTDIETAQVGVQGDENDRKDDISFGQGTALVPVIKVTWSEQWRRARAAAGGRTGSVKSHIEMAAVKRIALTIENMIVNGHELKVGDVKIRGMLNAPNRNTYSITEAAWNGTNTTEADRKLIFTELRGMIKIANDDDFYGAQGAGGDFVLAVGQDIYNNFQEDYRDDGAVTTIHARLLMNEYLSAIVVSDFIPANTVILFQADTDSFSFLNGVGTMTGEAMPNFFNKQFVTFAIGAPCPKDTMAGNSSFVIGT